MTQQKELLEKTVVGKGGRGGGDSLWDNMCWPPSGINPESTHLQINPGGGMVPSTSPILALQCKAPELARYGPLLNYKDAQ